MALFKCKMCGGSLEVAADKTVIECEYCGTKQTLPKLDDEKRANMYDRANHFRRNNEFDIAMGVYEQILSEDSTDSEAYWSVVLCRYGIEYVEDPASHRRIPTIHRAQYTSILNDADYKSALKNADSLQRTVYEAEAKAINEIQKQILSISQKEKPFDVFICYKETDNNGSRTIDSVLAQDLYYQLTKENLRVFFARITLEDKLGTAYEPYIFAALNSAKVMIVLGTKPEHFNAVWVKNEWSRYLSIATQSNGEKVLIPAYKDMSPYDLPSEFSHLQGQDMSKIGFLQDLIRGIKKIVKSNEPKTTVVKETVVTSGSNNVTPLIKRAFMFLEDGDWDSADEYCEKVLDIDPENAQAYLGKLMAELRVRKKEQLKDSISPFDSNINYKKILRFGDEKLKTDVLECVEHIKTRIKNERLGTKYNSLLQMMESQLTEEAYKELAKRFAELGDYKDARALSKECFEKAEHERQDQLYKQACTWQSTRKLADLENAICVFKKIPGWKDSDERVKHCETLLEQLKVAMEQERVEAEKKAKKKQKRNTVIILTLIALAVWGIILQNLIIPNSKYNNALALMEEGNYEEAREIFTSLNGYSSSEGKIAIIDALDGSIERTNADTTIKNVLYAGETVKVRYVLDSDNSASNESITYSSYADYYGLLTPEKEGYKFIKWNLLDRDYNENSLSLVFEAVWTEVGYSLTYDLDGGTTQNPSEYFKDSSAITLNNPTKTGYTFVGWTGTDLDGLTMNVTIPSGSYGNRTYQANWEPKTYTFTLDANGGEVSQTSVSAEYNSHYTLPTPIREYYTFSGWYVGFRKYVDGNWYRTGDVTLTAKWAPIEYSISYNLAGGTNSSSNPTMYTVETTKITLQDPTRNGYKFLGWYSDSNYQNRVTEIVTNSPKDFTLYAKWELGTYTITYNLNGGTISDSMPTTYTVNDLPISLPTPSKSDYVFLGWAKDNNGSDVSTITICEDITVYAKYMDVYLQLELRNDYSSGDYYAVTKYSGTAPVVDIPEKYEGIPITKIADWAFEDNTIVTTINIPDTVNRIGYSAFSRCSSLTSITIPSGIDEIDGYTFSGCTSLATVSIPDTVTSIGYNAFEGCSSLRNIQLPNKLYSLGNYAFQDCTLLESIEIPGTVESLTYYSFHGCTNLSTVILNEGLETIGSYVFTSEKITKLIIPKSVKSISDAAFEGSYSYSSGTYTYAPYCNNIVFYCRSATMPSGWEVGWNNSRPVIWGYNESSYSDPTYTFDTNGGTPVASVTQTEVYDFPISTKTGYVLVAWYDNAELSGEPVAFPYYSTSKTTLYAEWMSEEDYYDGSSFGCAYDISTEYTYSIELSEYGSFYCRFVPTETRSYTITTTNKPSVYCYLYDSEYSRLRYDYEYGYYNISITYTLNAGEEYYILFEPYYSYQTVTCEFTID